jgi:Flp pilus assembly pilin Flp
MSSRRRHHLHPFNVRAQSLAEYALLLALIFVVVAASMPLLGSSINGLYGGAAAFFRS